MAANYSTFESGCYVSGLFLKEPPGTYEAGQLRAQDPKVLVTELPIMQVIPIEASKIKLHNTFKTPVYVTQARKNAMGVGSCSRLISPQSSTQAIGYRRAWRFASTSTHRLDQ